MTKTGITSVLVALALLAGAVSALAAHAHHVLPVAQGAPVPESLFHHLEPVGYVELGGVCRGVAVEGRFAYVGNYLQGLSVVDVSDPGDPKEVVTVDTEGHPKDVEVAGRFAYVADHSSHDTLEPSALRIFDITDPHYPREMGALLTGGEGDGVELMDRYALFESDPNYLLVVDISDPATPRRSGVYDFGDGVRFSADLAVSGQYAFLAVEETGLHVVDVSDPTNPRRVGIYHELELAASVAVEGRYAYVGDEGDRVFGEKPSKMIILDVSSPWQPRKAGEYLFAAVRAPRSIRVVGDYAYATGAPDGWVHVIDVSEPSAPHEVAALRVSDEASNVAVAGQYLYVSTGDWSSGAGRGGLYVLRHDVIPGQRAFFPALVSDR